jgi:hypothetical protein
MKRAIALLFCAALVACGGDETDDGGSNPGDACAASFSAGLTQLGDAGVVSIVIESSLPAPPQHGDNDWTVKLLDSGGAPISDATVTISQFMPEHGHGSSVKANVTVLGNGRYALSPVNFGMPGDWEVTISVQLANGSTDKSMFQICIPD